jgi:hypothetical protein
MHNEKRVRETIKRNPWLKVQPPVPTFLFATFLAIQASTGERLGPSFLNFLPPAIEVCLFSYTTKIIASKNLNKSK